MTSSIGKKDFFIPEIMGILNVTPDSFFDGGKYHRCDDALRHAVQMSEAGASWVDIGGESTRPGAGAISIAEELDRVLPVVEAVVKEVGVPVSIDTSKPEVMIEAIKLGATFVNDIYALRKAGAKKIVAEYKVNVCLMHMHGEPRTMQQSYNYSDVTNNIKLWLKERIDDCLSSGINKQNIVIDPGFGFGKSDSHNLQVVNEIESFYDLGVPVLLGMSRKSTIGRVLNRELRDRVPGSLALAVIAALKGVSILRVHDVKETVDAVKIVQRINNL